VGYDSTQEINVLANQKSSPVGALSLDGVSPPVVLKGPLR